MSSGDWSIGDRGPLAAGVTIGSYRIETPIGEGGMGTVYRALDTKLNRPVAIKFLSNELADVDARRRFQREAQMASSLNHPHILTVHDVGEFEGRQYIVTEFVDGGTLKDWAKAEKRSWRQIAELLTGVADGLAAAHAAGITHRDIKPANILVATNGYAKLADFGLAKLVARPKTDDATETLTEGRTQPGVVVGTIAYMSPEQASGRPLDARSDVFSFGVVLYELLSGHRPFVGKTDLEVLQTIIHGAPAPLPEEIPLALRMAVEKALEKDPAERYQSMRDLVVDLKRLARHTEPASAATVLPEQAPVRSRRWIVPVGFAAIAVIGVLAYWQPWRNSRSALPQMTFTQITDAPGQEMSPGLSPDGKSLVYAGQASGNWDIYFQRAEGKTAINLTKDSPADDTTPAFSPDGEQIAFRSERDGGGIFLMGATGESVKRLTDFGYNPAWSPDGKQIVCATASFTDPDNLNTRASQLFIVDVATGEKRVIRGAQDAYQPTGPGMAAASPIGDAHRDRCSATFGLFLPKAVHPTGSPTMRRRIGTRCGLPMDSIYTLPAPGAEV